MQKLGADQSVDDAFKDFWTGQRNQAMSELCQKEGLNEDKVQKVIEDFQFTGRTPLREEIISALKEKPKLLQRRKIIDRVRSKILDLIRTFEDGMGDL